MPAGRSWVGGVNRAVRQPIERHGSAAGADHARQNTEEFQPLERALAVPGPESFRLRGDRHERERGWPAFFPGREPAWPNGLLRSCYPSAILVEIPTYIIRLYTYG